MLTREQLTIGHWYEGPSNHPNPRQIVEIHGGDICYRTSQRLSEKRNCWVTTFCQWAIRDLGTGLGQLEATPTGDKHQEQALIATEARQAPAAPTAQDQQEPPSTTGKEGLTLEQWLSENEELCRQATEGPWTTGPETLAGCVWVYARGAPLLEPEEKPKGLARLFRLFRLRSDGQRQWMPEETFEAKNQRFWRQKQADAGFIAASRLSLPTALEVIRAWRELSMNTPTEIGIPMEQAAEKIIREAQS